MIAVPGQALMLGAHVPAPHHPDLGFPSVARGIGCSRRVPGLETTRAPILDLVLIATQCFSALGRELASVLNPGAGQAFAEHVIDFNHPPADGNAFGA